MRLRALDVTRFGALVDQRFELDPRAVVVVGPNEAGKSCFHCALETALYGFSPASRENHPYALWDEATELLLVAELERSDGTPLAVERSLRGGPGMRLARRAEDLAGPRRGNGPLPGLEPFPRALFRAVYSLTANDTTFQRDEVKHQVSELLLGERGLEDARPIHVVRAELDEDRGRLWRPTDRGQPRAKQLRADLRQAQRDQREARKRERGLREEQVEQAALLAEGEALVARRDALWREAREAGFLEEVCELGARMDLVRPLRAEALAGTALDDPAPLAAELAELEAELSAPRSRLAAPVPVLPSGDAVVLERREEIEALLREAGVHAREREDQRAANERARGAAEQARARLARIGLHAPDAANQPLPDPAPLEQALRAWQAAAAAHAGSRGVLTPARLLLGAALACLVLAATGLLPPIAGLGALLALPAVLGRDRNLVLAHAPPGLAADLERMGLDPVSSPPALQRAIADLCDARALAAEARREEALAARLEQELARRAERWRRVAAGLVDPELPLADLPARLERRLTAVRAREDELRAALAQRARDEQHLATHQARGQRLRARLARLHAALAENFPDLEPGEAFAEWRRVEGEVEYVRRRERELRQDPRWEALAGDPRLELEDDARPWSAAAGAARAEELAAIETRLEKLRERRGAIGAHLEQDRGSPLAEAAERVTQLQDELAAILQERDRLALLERLLIVAERAHREAHQPDVLARAGRYLELVTGGRYTGLAYSLGEDGPLCVQPADREEPVPVDPPLSRGTREQIYLCLRLGTLDDLDRARERLPLVLDEALVHWDDERREALYPLLCEVAGRRQVILFTCHPELAAEAAQALGAEAIDLGARVAAGG